jgi:hypothetical protein
MENYHWDFALVVPGLANMYHGTIAYVPGDLKTTKKIVDQRFRAERDDLGKPYTEIQPSFSRISDLEASILLDCQQVEGKKTPDPLNEVVTRLISKQGLTPGDSLKMKYLRVIRELESRGLLKAE